MRVALLWIICNSNKPCKSGNRPGGHLSVIASDVTLRHWKCAEEGKWTPFAVSAILHHFGTFIKVLPQPPLPPLRTTLYICKKNFSTGAHAPLRQRSLHVNSGQMWGDMRRRDAVGFSLGVLLMSLAGNAKSWNTWMFLFYFNRASLFFFSFFFFQLERLMPCVVTWACVVSIRMMSWAALSTGKFI